MTRSRGLGSATEPKDGGSAEKQREWTFMVYLAGDNSLEAHGRADLTEMKKIGSSPQVAIVAQYDRMREGATRRYYLRRGGRLEDDIVGSPLEETNSGDPRELVYFLTWAMGEYPAKRYALILWNHGSGWREDDLYRAAKSSRIYRASLGPTIGSLVRGFVERTTRPALFAPTINAVLARGIAYDDTSCDFLDNSEMKQAIGCSLLSSGLDKLTLVGFDACLMSRLEVAYQLREVTEYLVGSQETEPAEGWPYQTILGELVDEPTMDGCGLASMIVAKYAGFYGTHDNITQSALKLGLIRDVVLALDDLCASVLEHQEECELAVGRASRRAQKYSDPDYKDLYDLCRLIYERTHEPPLRRRARSVMDLLGSASSESFVCAEAHSGESVARSHGVSIYFPVRAMSPFYKRLDFASESLWDDMLHRMLGV